MKELEEIGIGPFGGLDAEPTVRWEVWGEPTEEKLKMLFAKIGPLEVELIEPISDCMQKAYLDTHGEGIQHYSFFVDNIDDVIAWMAEKGYSVVQRGWRPTKGGYAFFDTEEKCGFMLEIIER